MVPQGLLPLSLDRAMQETSRSDISRSHSIGVNFPGDSAAMPFDGAKG
jgi:hypothetical protein